MNKRTAFVVAVLWAVSLLSVGLWAQGRRGERPEVSIIGPGQPFGPIISGEDFGFQRTASPSGGPGTVTGRIVVRINGEWLEVAFPVRLVPAR